MTTTSLVAEYRYFVADLLTGSIIQELFITGVKWERKTVKPGAFSGTIPVDESQDVFDIYNCTMPGKRALYVVRDDVCVWGGIIWGRSYSLKERRLNIDALEFTSYLYHRLFWTTMNFPTSGSTITLYQLLYQIITEMQLDFTGKTITENIGAPDFVTSDDSTLGESADVRITVDSSFSSSAYNVTLDSQAIRGHEMHTIGDYLEKLAATGAPLSGSTGVVRFDYYIECSYNSSTFKFDNVFRIFPIIADERDPSGAVTTGLADLLGPTNLQAGYFVFEHPGNIENITLNESSDSAATRTWSVDSGNDLGAGAARYYGSWSNTAYLNDNWPIIEKAHTDRDYLVGAGGDAAMQPYAKAIGYREAPPIGTLQVSVNGSFLPEVGSYRPGDWCVIIPNDPFINQRLKLPYENRSNILVRKIVGISVDVPDNPSFPEIATLDLVAEWEVV
jgi:hypothetical protein